MRKSGIYCIENTITNNKYIGQSVDVEKRMRAKHYGSVALMDAINKYGIENFSFYVLEYCEETELDEKETYYIKELKSHVTSGGYNISYGGNTPQKGRKLSKETKEKISSSLIGKMAGKNNPMYGKTGEKNPLFGKKRPPEFVEKFSGRNSPNFLSKKENSTSEYYGVSYSVEKGKYPYWRVEFSWMGENIRLSGSYTEEIEAAKAYDKYILENNIERDLNFPELAEETLNSKIKTRGEKREKSSQYIGVAKIISNGYEYWIASSPRINGKQIRIGYYDSETDAAKAYDDFIVNNNLKNKLNFHKNN